MKTSYLIKEIYYDLVDVVKTYDYTKELHAMLTLAVFSLYLSMDKACLNDLMRVIKCSSIYYEDFNIDLIIKKYGFNIKVSEKNNLVINALTINEKYNNPTILISKKHNNQYKYLYEQKLHCLELLIHELRHLLTNIHDTNYYIKNDIYYERFGLEEKFSSNKEWPLIMGNTLDEVTNTFITEKLVNYIIQFNKELIDVVDIVNYLNNIQYIDIYKSKSYQFEKVLLKELLNNQYFLEQCNYHAYYGNLLNFKNTFNNYSDYISYEDFNKLLDYISNNSYQCDLKYIEEFKRYTNNINSNINKDIRILKK